MLQIYLFRKSLITKKLSQCNAYSEESAKTFLEAGISKPDRFKRITDKLEKQKIIVRTKDNRYYLNK